MNSKTIQVKKCELYWLEVKILRLRACRRSRRPLSFLPLKEEEKTETSTRSQSEREIRLTLRARPSLFRLRKAISFNFGPPFWTIASVLSLTVNVILLILLLAVLQNVRILNLGSAMEMGNGLLGGLYTNFEKMDRAHITRTIPVETTIPVKFDLQLNQQTNVVLSQDVTINNALVTVKTGGLNITNALTTIVLPAGNNSSDCAEFDRPCGYDSACCIECRCGYSTGPNTIARTFFWFAGSCQTILLYGQSHCA